MFLLIHIELDCYPPDFEFFLVFIMPILWGSIFKLEPNSFFLSYSFLLSQPPLPMSAACTENICKVFPKLICKKHLNPSKFMLEPSA